MSEKSVQTGIVVGVLLLHLLMFGFALTFVFVGLTDVLGNRAAASTLLIAVLCAIVVLHAIGDQRSSKYLDTSDWLKSLGRAADSYYLVMVSAASDFFPLIHWRQPSSTWLNTAYSLECWEPQFSKAVPNTAD